MYHISTLYNIESIEQRGLLLEYARNQRFPYVWFVSDLSKEVAHHVAKRHSVNFVDLVVLKVLIDRTELIQHPLMGKYGHWTIYKTRKNITTDRLKVIRDYYWNLSVVEKQSLFAMDGVL